MNLLKNTLINGEIYEEYAFLSYEFEFENTTSDGITSVFAFEIPEKSHISGMKIGTTDGRLINTTVDSVSHLAQVFNDKEPFAMLRQTADGRCLLSITKPSQSKMRVFIDIYTPLPRVDDEQRLTIPISSWAQISLVLNSEAEAVSSTHQISNNNDGIRRITAEADRDFCLCLRNAPLKNSAIAVRGDFGGEMLCRFYPTPDFYQGFARNIEQILFIYDGTGSLCGGAANAAREAIFSMAESFGKDYALIFASDTPFFATSGSITNSAEKLISILADAPKLGGSLAECFELAKEYIKDGILPVLVCGDCFIEGEYAAKCAVKYLGNSGLCTLAIGGRKAAGYITAATEQCGGRCENIFGMDNIKKRSVQILKSFLMPVSDEVKVMCHGADVAVIGNSRSMYDGVTVYASYKGNREPREFILKNRDYAEKFMLDKIPIYNSFAPIGLVCAAELAKKAEQRLEFCNAEQVIEIKKYIEEVGVEFSALNSETALVADDGTDVKAIRVVIENNNTYKDVFKDRASMFRETATVDDTERTRRIALCRDMIIKSVRADGAICSGGEIIRELRIRQTLICVLALVASGGYDEYKMVIKAAKDYIGDYEFGGIRYTENVNEAVEMLGCRMHGTACDMPTDIMTAALMLADRN